MKKLAFGLILIVGGYFVYRLAGDYWLGLCLAFALTCRKLHLGDALRLWGIVLAIVAIMLGGGLIIARQWGGSSLRCLDCFLPHTIDGPQEQNHTPDTDIASGPAL